MNIKMKYKIYCINAKFNSLHHLTKRFNFCNNCPSRKNLLGSFTSVILLLRYKFCTVNFFSISVNSPKAMTSRLLQSGRISVVSSNTSCCFLISWISALLEMSLSMRSCWVSCSLVYTIISLEMLRCQSNGTAWLLQPWFLGLLELLVLLIGVAFW